MGITRQRVYARSSSVMVGSTMSKDNKAGFSKM
jgi:hypothetical protein